MATLTDENFTEIKNIIRNDSSLHSVFRNWVLSKSVYKAAFQSAEDWFVNGFSQAPSSSFKAAIELVTGATTVARAKALAVAWIKWRFNQEL